LATLAEALLIMDNAITTLLAELQIQPVLLHIGATDRPPEVWDAIASQSIYVGVGPEADPHQSGFCSRFHRATVLDYVVLSRNDCDATLHLTKNRIYSSTLHHNPAVASEFVGLDCQEDGEVSVHSTTIESILDRLSLPSLDWLYTNVNGRDVEIWRSIPDRTARRVVAVDSCLDFLELYSGQEASISAYREFIDAGFWLSRLAPWGGVRMRRDSLQRLSALHRDVDEKLVSTRHRRTPGWLFVRFLRTLDSLAGEKSSPRDYVVLWSFALVDNQIGFAADVAFAYERLFGRDTVFDAMLAETVGRVRDLKVRGVRQIAGRLLPGPFKRGIKRMLLG
jgi:hypothetical protein